MGVSGQWKCALTLNIIFHIQLQFLELVQFEHPLHGCMALQHLYHVAHRRLYVRIPIDCQKGSWGVQNGNSRKRESQMNNACIKVRWENY